MEPAEVMQNPTRTVCSTGAEDSFSRIDESDDALFYAVDRFVQHLDETALETVKKIIEDLVVEERPAILDLMASWDSHLPARLHPSRVAGLGLNENELSRNTALTEYVVRDLNTTPALPFADDSFDAVINIVSVDYLTRPREVFREAGRILKPGGLFLIVFSNRMFPEKATKIWREATEEERVELVVEFLATAGEFEPPRTFVSYGLPRPAGDKYARLGIPSDPVYAVYAEKKGTDPGRGRRPEPTAPERKPQPARTASEAGRPAKDVLLCPHCGEQLHKWAVPNSPFSNWDTDFMFVCFNDCCPYFTRGWDVLRRQGVPGTSYRYMCDESGKRSMPFPVCDADALKAGIVD